MNTHQTGSAAEDRAVRFLKEHGYLILDRNYRFGHTEIDIIAKEKDYLVFIEVKYRKTAVKGHPLAAVGQDKQQRISAAALQYMLRHGYGLNSPCRFDVLAFLGEEALLVKDAFPFRFTKGW